MWGERCRLLPVVDTSSSFSRELSRVDKLTFRLSQLLPGLPTVLGTVLHVLPSNL